MSDYGHDLQFGYFLVPDNDNPGRLLETAQLLDELGYDLIGIQDHPYQPRHFDTLSLIATILAQTERVRVFPDVANLALRPPLMLAKAGATLDVLSHGRFELGLGSGAFWEGVAAMGGPRLSPADAVLSVAEAIPLLRAYWRGERSVRFNGEIYQARGAHPGPLPLHDIRIWLGVSGPRMLKLTGQAADGWIPSMSYISPAKAAQLNAIIDAAAVAAGRPPSAIRRIYNVPGAFTPAARQPPSDLDQEIVGPVEHWTDALTRLAINQGFSSFLLWTPPDHEALRLFINEVAPAVRERVTTERAAQV
jgi:alkanesulfonate monooxygenase SsuD/methylene tetrahydromethanopterin reductase-like flavin-dependent oxidoreductase (luciferase family)